MPERVQWNRTAVLCLLEVYYRSVVVPEVGRVWSWLDLENAHPKISFLTDSFRLWLTNEALIQARTDLQRRSRSRRPKKPGRRVDHQLLAGMGDIEISHRQLPDAILRRELATALLHCEPFRLVRQIRTLCVQDGVIIAAAQFECHGTA